MNKHFVNKPAFPNILPGTGRKEPEGKNAKVKTSENFVEEKNVRRRYFGRSLRR